jgi:hypothetical protein
MAKGDRRSGTSSWGLPDPRDGGAYVKPAEAPMTAWAWEFLRRRRNYRQRWDRLVGRFLNERGELDHDKIERERAAAEINAIRNKVSFEWTMPIAALGDEFGLDYSPISGNGLLDPRVSRPPIFKINRVVMIHRIDRVRPPKVLIEFDVELPIQPQMLAAQQELDRRAKRVEPIRMQVEKFPRYLQYLDFHDTGALDAIIGRHLFPGQNGEKLRNSLRNTFEAALRWSDDYRRIAAS